MQVDDVVLYVSVKKRVVPRGMMQMWSLGRVVEVQGEYCKVVWHGEEEWTKRVVVVFVTE